MTSPPPIPAPFLFNATVIDFHDGDTGFFEVDRGVNGEFARWDIRLLGCNAAELAQPGGVEARDNLRALLPAGTPLVLDMVKPDKFGGRLDAQVFYRDKLGGRHDLVADLVATGWLAAWNGQGPKPVPPWPRQPTSAISALLLDVPAAARAWRANPPRLDPPPTERTGSQ